MAGETRLIVAGFRGEEANVLNALRQNLFAGLFLRASHLAYITKGRKGYFIFCYIYRTRA